MATAPYGHQGELPPKATAPYGHQGELPPKATAPYGHQGELPPKATAPYGHQGELPPKATAPYGHQGELPPKATASSAPKDPLQLALDHLKTAESPEVMASSTQESLPRDQEESAPPHLTQSAPPHLFPSVQVTPPSENGTPQSPQVAPLKEEVEGALKEVIGAAGALKEVIGAAGELKEVIGAAGELKEEAEGAAGALKEEVEGAAGALKEEVEGAAGALKEEVEGAAGALKEEAEGAAGALKEEVEGAAGALKEEVEGAAGARKEEVVGSRKEVEKEAVSESKTKADGPTLPVIHEPEEEPECPRGPRGPAPDSLSYLESASVMSGTMESLSGLDDCSSVGSDSEVNGLTAKRTDKYGFLGGNQYSDREKEVRVEVSRQREMKWLDMFNHWDKWVKHRFQKVKLRCRKGVPSSLRARAWQLLSNSHQLLHDNPGKFEELEREQGEAKWLDIIEKDLHRQFPFHEMFAARGGHGQQDLFRILKAYTVYRPEEGYCQAQAPVAAVLLMHMPAEQAFWCLVQICEKYLPGYYSAGLEAIQLDGEVFFSLLRRISPMSYRHLKKFKIDPILYMTEWFMCIYSRTLPWASVLRVWDMFFCEGVKVVFRVGLVLLKQMLGSVEKLKEVQGMYETMERLRNISPDMIREEVLVQEIVTLPISESLIERECGVQVRKWRESRGALTHEPGRRLHGTRHVYEHKRRASSLASGGSFSFLSSSAPPPGPLRASSSLLSLPGFRRSKPFFAQPKKASFSGATSPPRSPPAAGDTSKPPLPPKSVHVQSPLAASKGEPHANKLHANEPHAKEPHAKELHANSLSPRVVSEQITPQIPSPTANNTPLLAADLKPEDEEAKKGGKKSKEERRRKEKEEERRRQKEKRDREKAEKEHSKKEKERQEREKRRSGKKKTGGGAEEAGGAAAKDRV